MRSIIVPLNDQLGHCAKAGFFAALAEETLWLTDVIQKSFAFLTKPKR
jgi:hypothetical protein